MVGMSDDNYILLYLDVVVEYLMFVIFGFVVVGE